MIDPDIFIFKEQQKFLMTSNSILLKPYILKDNEWVWMELGNTIHFRLLTFGLAYIQQCC